MDEQDEVAEVPDRAQSAEPRGSTAFEDGAWTQDWRVWIVLSGLLIGLVVVPWSLILLPTVQDSVGVLGFSFRDAYLVVPLIPALGLGALGVWTALRSRRG